MERRELIVSPSFTMNPLKKSNCFMDDYWALYLKPNVDDISKGLNNNSFTVCLRLRCTGNQTSRSVNVVISVRETNGLFEKSKHHTFTMNSLGATLSFNEFFDEVFKDGYNAYLDHDELTLRCRMWKDGSQLSQSVQCYSTTRIRTLKMFYMWKLVSFMESETQQISKYTTTVLQFSEETCPLQVKVFYMEDQIYLSIQQLYTYLKKVIACKVSLLDADEREVYIVKYQLFPKLPKPRIWKLAVISKPKLLEENELFLPHGTLKLMLEFTFLRNEIKCEVERWEFGTGENDQICTNLIKGVDSPGRAWANNFQHLYSEGKFSDLIVRTPTKEFGVHKAILCAQSEVFRAMFDHDLKKNQKGAVELKIWVMTPCTRCYYSFTLEL